MLLKAVFLLAAFLTAQVGSAAELFPKNSPRPYELADKLEPDATMGGYPIWAGEGKWRLFELTRSDSTGGASSVPLGAARFFQTEGKNFVAAMEVRSNLQNGSGFWLGEPCKRDDMLFKSQLAGGREDNCVTINHITRYMSNPGGKAAELYAMLKEQRVDVPPTVIQIAFTRNAQSSRTLTYILWINPELSGLPRETEPEWGRNPWNKTMSFKDPTKKQYIDALTAWAINFQKRMNDALDQKPDAFAGIPSWRNVLDGAVKPEQTKAKVDLD
jgi:hypothetical protein